MTLTIYRTNYQLYDEHYVLCYSLAPALAAQMDQWEDAHDRMVFDEQMATGSFRGRFQVDESYRDVMQRLQQEGYIQPYYGSTNAKACTYTLTFNPPFVSIVLHHTVVDDTVSFEDEFVVVSADATTVAMHHRNGFMIRQQEYQNLCAWEHWNSRDEFTSRYRYYFAPTTVLLLVEVTDTTKDAVIDITDYDHW